MALHYPFSPQELTGRSRTHIAEVAEPGCSLHRAVVEPFLAMRDAARRDGIEMVAASSFRDFARQLAIWNGKCRGERPLLDSEGRVLDPATLGEDALVDAVLQWSALPGTSRHHWGTDFDVIDRNSLPAGYRVQFIPQEFAAGGMFGRLDAWLSLHAADFGFFRPYGSYRGGVQPEAWHLSFAPVAQAALAQFSVEVLREALDSSDILARAAVERRLPQIVERYVRNIDAPPSQCVGLARDEATRATRPV